MGGCQLYHLLVLLLVGSIISMGTSDNFDAYIYLCETNSSDSWFASGSDIQLCCYLTNRACNTSESFELTLGSVSGDKQNTSTECVVKLEIRNVSMEDAGWFECRKNHVSISSKMSLIVVEKPVEPKIKELLISDNFDVIVKFDRGEVNEKVTTEYFITMHDRNGAVEICATNCSSAEKNPVCECRHINNVTDYSPGQHNKNTTFTIKAARPRLANPVQSVQIQESFNLYHHIVPGCVENLKFKSIESTIVFTLPVITNRITGFMDSSKPLVYHVVLLQKDGVPEKIEMNFTKKRLQESVEVKIPRLYAFTKYRVEVYGQGGGGAGCREALDFITKTAAPAAPPDIDDFSFTRVSINSTDFILVMWKELPQTAKGDISVSYKVTVSGSNGVMYSLEVNETHHYIDPQQVSFPASVQIWAVNQQGFSANKSEIVIPKIKETVLPTTAVEFITEDVANIHFSNLLQADQLLIHWCHGSIGGNLCSDYPQTKVTNVSSMFKVNMATTVNKVPQKENVEIEVYEFENGEDLPEPRKIYAIKIMNPSDADPQDPDPFSFVREDMSRTKRRRRSKKLKHRNWRRLKKSAAVKPPEVGTKFYFSYKVQGSWSGMVPASCYFDWQKSKAQIAAIIEEKNGKKTLRINKQCDTGEPEYFLIEKYKLFSSADIECQLGKQSSDLNITTIFNDSLVEIPQDTKCVKVQGLRSDGHMTDITVKDPSYRGGFSDSNVIIISVVVGTILTTLAFGVIGKLVCQCRKRKKYFLKMQQTDLEPVLQNSDASAALEEQTKNSNSTINQMTSDISFGLDSGHGSANTSGVESRSQHSMIHNEPSPSPSQSASDESSSSRDTQSTREFNTTGENSTVEYKMGGSTTGDSTTGDSTTGDGATGDSTTNDGAGGSKETEDKSSCNQKDVLKKLGFSFKPASSNSSSNSSGSSSRKSDSSNESYENSSQETCSSDCTTPSGTGGSNNSSKYRAGGTKHSSMQVAGDSSHSSMEGAGDSSHFLILGAGDFSHFSMQAAGDSSHSSMEGAGDSSHSSMQGACDSSHFPIQGAGDSSHFPILGAGDSSHSSIQGTGDSSHSSIIGAGDNDSMHVNV